jgi:hypothetical protein
MSRNDLFFWLSLVWLATVLLSRGVAAARGARWQVAREDIHRRAAAGTEPNRSERLEQPRPFDVDVAEAAYNEPAHDLFLCAKYLLITPVELLRIDFVPRCAGKRTIRKRAGRSDMTSKTFNLLLAAIVIGGFMLLNSAVMWQMSPARGHDYNRLDLSNWFMSLHSKHGAPCCDGSEAMHLSNVDWTAPDSSSHQYRARIPKTGALYDLARQGFEVESKWVDVPDGAVIDDPNMEGTALVWPTYGSLGATVRCFMPGVEG